MKYIVLCRDCEVYPAETGNGIYCRQCLYGAPKSVDGEKPLTKTEQAHTLLSQAVANGKASGTEALVYWQQWVNRPKQPFFPRRKAQEETEEEKRLRLAKVAEETRKLYPQSFAS